MSEEKKLTGYPSIDKPWLKYYSEEAINASLPKCTIYEYIRDCNNNRMEKPAINYFGKKYTYQQLFSSIEITAKAFTALGVKTGDVVSLCMLSMPETVYSIYALNRLGAVCNIIEPRTNADLIKERIKSANSTVLIVVDIFLNKIINIANETCNIYGSVGIPLIFTTVKIVNPETYEELKYGETGEICMTGPTMMLGYYKNDSETKKVIREHKDGNKWIHSGDIGYMTEDGVIFIVDRMKRMIIRPDGHNVWPSQIESVITSHPLVLDCAVVGLKSKESENGKIPTAFVAVKEGVNATQELINDIDKFSKKHLPERDAAMAYQFCKKLPLTLVGKVDYLSLEKQNL